MTVSAKNKAKKACKKPEQEQKPDSAIAESKAETPPPPEKSPVEVPKEATQVVPEHVKLVPAPRLAMLYKKYEQAKDTRGFWGRLFGKKPPEKKLPNSFIIRYENGCYAGRYEYIENPIGLPYRSAGWLYLFTLHDVADRETGEVLKELRPLIPSDVIKVLPDALYRKLHKWWSYKKVMSDALRPTFMEKLKLGMALGFFGISVLALFLIVVSVAG